jgi:hypothetical protein
MGVHILHDPTYDYCCFYCSVVMWAFGPIMYSEEEAEEFLEYLKKDPREYKDKELESEYYEFRQIRDNEICPACKCKSINTNGGDCYCAECGHKWTV